MALVFRVACKGNYQACVSCQLPNAHDAVAISVRSALVLASLTRRSYCFDTLNLMIERLSRLALSAMGQKHLIPFVNGLIYIGRPSEVKFPKELMGQGASILLSGLNNTMAFQSNPDWVWPWWYERQRNPEGNEFVPTGMNLITSNITSRNWVSLGVQGSSMEAMLDPMGMLTPGEYAWSVFPYIRIDGTNYLPPLLTASQVKQRLDADGLSVLTNYDVDQRIAWCSHTEALRIGDEELVVFTHKLSNQSQEEISFTLGVSLRPYNPLSVAHIHKVKFKHGLWRINHQAALWMLDEPTRILAADRNGADPIFLCAGCAGRVSKSSKSGIAAGVAEYDWTLQVGEERILVTVATLRKRSRDPLARFHKPTLNELQIAHDVSQKAVAQDAKKGLQINIPDTRWMQAFAAVRKRLHVFDDGSHFSPGTYLYHHFWIRDNAFLFLTHMELGLTERLSAKLSILQKVQQRDGYFKSQEGEWDSNGQAMFTMVNAVIASGNMEQVALLWPSMRAGAQWIEHMLTKSRNTKTLHAGLMPAGFSAEHFGPNDHYYWDNFWSLQGLRDALWMAEMVGTAAEQKWLRELVAEFTADLEENMRTSFQRVQNAGLPSSPYRKVDSSAIGNLLAIAPLDLVRLDSPWIKPTLESLWKESVTQGMFLQKIVHTGLNAYLTIQLARGFLAVQDERWHSLLQSVLDHASPVWTWPEAIHPRTGGGCMGDGDHGWAAAEFLSFTVSLLVRVQQDALLLAHGIPVEWYTADMDVFVHGAVTRFGTVSWRLRGQGECAILTWSVVRNQAQRKVPIHFALPVSLGFAHPRMSGFVHGRKFIQLSQDQGSLEIPIPENIPGK